MKTKLQTILLLAGLVLATFQSPAATRTWTGGAILSDLWSDKDNWSGDLAPESGDRLVFPAGLPQSDKGMVNTFGSGTVFQRLTFDDDGYTVSGTSVHLSGGMVLNMPGGVVRFDVPVRLTANQTFQLTGIDTPHLTLQPGLTGPALDLGAHILTIADGGFVRVLGDITGSGGLTLGGTSGAAQVSLLRATSYTGLTVILSGGYLSLTGDSADLQLALPTPGTTDNPTHIYGTLIVHSSRDGVLAEPLKIFDTGRVELQKDPTFPGLTTLTGDIELSGPGRMDLQVSSLVVPALFHVDSAISGNGELFKPFTLATSSQADLAFGGTQPNTFTGSFHARSDTTLLAKPTGVTALSCGSVFVDPPTNASAVLRLNASHQIVDTASVVVQERGTFDLQSRFETIGSLTLAGGTVNGSAPGQLDVTESIFSLPAGVSGTVNAEVHVHANPCEVNVQDGVPLNDLVFNGTVVDEPGASIRKTGPGRVVFKELTTLPVEIAGGTAVIEQGGTSFIRLNGGTLAGNGSVGVISSLADGGRVAPGLSTGIITNATLAWNSATTYEVEILNATPGTGHDQLKVFLGTVTLGGAQLEVITLPGFSAALGQDIVIIENNGTAAITNTFAGLPNGAEFTTASGAKFTIHYDGGTGNDVVLRTTFLPPATAGLQNTLYTGSSFGTAGAGDQFGSAFAVGQLVRGPVSQTLAIGIPGAGGGRVVTRSAATNGIQFNTSISASGEVLPPGGVNSTFWGVPAQGNGRFGQTLAAGDFDGDGFKEIVIGAPGMGRVFILDGKAGAPKVSRTGSDNFGAALAVGDFDHDGLDDLAVGTPAMPSGNAANAGRVTVFYGRPDGLTLAPSVFIVEDLLPTGLVGGNEANDQFGFALAAGDVTGDLADDLIVSAPGESYNGVGGAGVVFVIPGTSGVKSFQLSAASLRDARSVATPFTGPQVDARFGETLALGRFGGGVLTKLDLAVGAPSQDIGGMADAGFVAVYRGSSGALATNATIAFCRTNLPDRSVLQSIRFGDTLAAGDFSGDDITDLAVAAPRLTAGAPEAGAVFLIHGSRPPPTTVRGCALCPPPVGTPPVLAVGSLNLANAQTLLMPQFGRLPVTQDHFGGNRQFVSPNALAAFDLDADGQSDLLIGAPEAFAEGQANAGLFAIRYGLRVGEFTLTPSHAVAIPGETVFLELAWTHPNLWTDLDSVQLRLVNNEGVVAWLRFDETTRTLSFHDDVTDTFSDGQPFGTNYTFANPWVTLNLAQSSFTTTGPAGRTVTMRFALTLSALTACQEFQVQLFASDDHGNAQGFDDAGTLSSGDCAPRLVAGQFQFRYPTQPGYHYTVESREAVSGDPGTWADRVTTTGDGSIFTYHEPAGGTQGFFRLRITPP